MLYALILLPLLAGGMAFAIPSRDWRPLLLPVTGALHLALTGALLAMPPVFAPGAWLGLDALGKLVLLIISTLYFGTSLYAFGYLRQMSGRNNRVFCACILVMLGMMSLVVLSQHLGLLWIAVETTTLASAPLIYFYNTPHAIEATWKYLFIGSIGVALALLGTYFLAYSSLQPGALPSLYLADLLQAAPHLSKPWLYAAFALLLIGYGTKMGLAPMHTWKPDAYGEAPGVVGALLAGGVSCCAFLAVLRIYQVCQAAGEGARIAPLLLVMGLLSMAVAAVFMVGQRDFKRMLAYSSVEHMGILLLGIGIGGGAIFGVMLHLINNAMAKGSLFLCAGSIHQAYQSKSIDEVRGALRRVPLSGPLFLLGFIAVIGTPPFGVFISEFTILTAALERGCYASAILFLVFLMVIFIGMGATVLAVVQGRVPAAARVTPYRDGWLTGFASVLLLLPVLLMGLYIPAPLQSLLTAAAQLLEAKP